MTSDLGTTTVEEFASDEEAGHPLEGRRNGDGSAVVPDRRRPRRWLWLTAGLGLGAVGTLVVASALDSDEASTGVVEEPVVFETVLVERRDLVEAVEWDGELVGGDRSSIVLEQGGTITAAPEVGDLVDRGDVLVRVDDAPVVALIGDVPMWRELSEGDAGDDVWQLQANLVRLGFDPDDDVVIDGDFDLATEDMVEAWQESLGVEDTGVVQPADVVVLAGPSEVVAVPAVGVATGPDGVITLETTSLRFDVVVGGTDTDDETLGWSDMVAEPGTGVVHGTTLLSVDDRQVVAVVDVSDETAAVLGAMEDDDVEALEAVLVYIGFDPVDEIVIDDELDDATTAALERWQAESGLPTTGSVDRGDYVLIPAEPSFTVAERFLEPGDRLDESDVVMALGSPTLGIAAEIAVDEVDDFEVGQVVTVEQLDETTFSARVVEIADIATPAVGDASPTITIDFDVVDEPAEFVSGPVVIVTEASRIDDALVVPTRALLTLREGGYAVERQLPGGSTELVGVDLGTFDDGVVEIVSVTAGELVAGDEVVVPT